MIKLLCDTNYLLDLVDERRPDSSYAVELFALVADRKIRGIISPTSLKDFYYIARKALGEAKRRSYLRLFIDTFEIPDIGRDVCKRALESDEPDFEDAIIRVVAETNGCDHIISRDEEAFHNSPSNRMTAKEFLES